MATRPVIYVDTASYDAARAALGEKADVERLYLTDGMLVLSQRAGFFDPAWWGDEKLVEAALKRARAEKRKGKK